jgi:hypothetical protein
MATPRHTPLVVACKQEGRLQNFAFGFKPVDKEARNYHIHHLFFVLANKQRLETKQERENSQGEGEEGGGGGRVSGSGCDEIPERESGRRGSRRRIECRI